MSGAADAPRLLTPHAAACGNDAETGAARHRGDAATPREIGWTSSRSARATASGKGSGPALAKARIQKRRRRKEIEEQARVDELALLVPSALNAVSIVRLLSPRAAPPSYEKELKDKDDEERVKKLMSASTW